MAKQVNGRINRRYAPCRRLGNTGRLNFRSKFLIESDGEKEVERIHLTPIGGSRQSGGQYIPVMRGYRILRDTLGCLVFVFTFHSKQLTLVVQRETDPLMDRLLLK